MIQPWLTPRWLVVSEMSEPAGGFDWSQRRVGGRVVVGVAGELDISASRELRQRLAAVVELGAPVVVLDLSDLRFIDAHCIGLIVAASHAARDRGLRLAVDGLRGTPALVFGLLGVRPLLSPGRGGEKAGRQAHGRYRRAPGLAARQRSMG
jgi:anti-anti-sigma factor